MSLSTRLENAPCGIVEFGDDGIITYANTTLATWLGFSADELIGMNFESVLTLANRVFFHTHFFSMVKASAAANEIFLSLRAKDGTPLSVITSATSRDGTTQCVFLAVAVRAKFESAILKARRLAEDALENDLDLKTIRQTFEEKAHHLDRQLRELGAKNEELRHVSRILYHDLRQPLRKMRMFADVVREEAGPALNAEGAFGLAKITTEAQCAIDLITSIQRFLLSGNMRDGWAPVALNDVINAAADQVRKISPDWELVVGALPAINGHPVQLQEFFEELFHNAVKFRAPSRPLRVTITSRIIQQNSYHVTEDRYRYSDFVELDIADNGGGFDPKYKDYVFELLKKVDLTSAGFGIGLAICRKIATAHHGYLDVASTLGQGTIFTVQLPLPE
jgi:sigma-B regulation protein RsbU (phosphoserine phosphatase)